jgi:hypothetical protein
LELVCTRAVLDLLDAGEVLGEERGHEILGLLVLRLLAVHGERKTAREKDRTGWWKSTRTYGTAARTPLPNNAKSESQTFYSNSIPNHSDIDAVSDTPRP